MDHHPARVAVLELPAGSTWRGTWGVGVRGGHMGGLGMLRGGGFGLGGTGDTGGLGGTGGTGGLRGEVVKN